ncbi:hypothetical protein [Chitinophaga filiformis]|uniref:PBCV-specific basic adaptor domain-containing protein n=1 Tax=Chitinophaga filiformis TaxID=104663 RepID=A0ABY4I530_CHIFI|nr:hypothetical protein [Chitinophaga filiformis]UPK70753.1 hypothetical protein MYF79_05505 [Chitinophaga filiformis]
MNSITLRKGLLAVTITASALFFGQQGIAQGIDSTAKKIGKKTAAVANKTANKTASVAVKGAMKITDKTYKGKEGPNGETVYIDKNDRKYFVDDKGKKVYLKASEIRDKQEK